ncbi:hypothetical protein EJ08DRAFT_654908 [Tothia fuscella]|uniref:Transcription elongation factor SPT5 n=1 Tax=Tothia fuscella TaxID=1048955 RepID=A0A9P4P515_9PEZI|nr:hypothetical protein EJ08DRAFT_654908 [Tothia fuscella]
MADPLNHDDVDEESEEDTFNPAPAIDSDAEEEPEPGSPAQDAKIRRKSSDSENARPVQDGLDEDDGEDEDAKDDNNHEAAPLGSDEEENGAGEDEEGGEDVDEEEEEEEEVEDRPRKRHKRDKRFQFLDVEAEVDDEEEEEEEDEDGLPGDEMHPDDLVAETGADHDDRRHRDLDRQRELAANLDAEKQAAALRERHSRRNRTAMTEVSGIPQHLLLPSVEDPKIWLIRVKHGKEAEVINLIMKRYAERMESREPIRITSAFGRGGSTMAGYIYVEARQQADVYAAADEISFCYPRTKCEMVPLSQMPDLLKTVPPKALEPGQWVRVRRPMKYAGDLAQITDVEGNGSDVTVKIIPRIDYGLEEDMNGPAAKRKRPGFPSNTGPRPPQRLFSEIDARKKMGRFVQQMSTLNRKHFSFQNDQYVDGFLIKDMKINALQTEDVNPTLEEVSKFASGDSEGQDNLDLASIAASLKANTTTSDYLPGDKVEIYQGEQQGVRGQAVSVRGDIVTIKVTEGELAGQRIEAPAKGLRKLFREGDHVKVIGGSKYHDEVGMVVRVKEDRVTLLTDANNIEITVFSKDLREASDSSSAQGYSKYQLNDLVQLDATTVACVIKIDRESLRVLDQNGTVLTRLPSNISNKIEHRRHAVATDREGSEIRNEDTVKEYTGEQRQGRVIHIHRQYLFIQNRQQAENAGMFVARSTNVTSVAAKGGRVNAGPDLTKMNPLALRNGGGAGIAMGPPKATTFGRDKLIGKTVKIKKGPNKGLLGIVKDTTDESARVELHTKSKIAVVPKDAVMIIDSITGNPLGAGRGGRGGFGGGPGRFGAGTPGGSRVPDYSGGSRTPFAAGGGGGGRTPAWSMQDGARTPAGGANGGRTPGWSQGGGGRTPGWSGGNDGSRTSYGNDGSRTAYGGRTEYGGPGQTWSASARTPFASNSGFAGNDSGSKTPAWGAAAASTPAAFSGNRTPAHPGAYNATTPAAYGAPTPYNSAPTPGAYAPTPAATGDAPTPRPYGAYNTPASAPTPGGYPETPGAFAAETPGGYLDDDPRLYLDLHLTTSMELKKIIWLRRQLPFCKGTPRSLLKKRLRFSTATLSYNCSAYLVRFLAYPHSTVTTAFYDWLAWHSSSTVLPTHLKSSAFHYYFSFSGRAAWAFISIVSPTHSNFVNMAGGKKHLPSTRRKTAQQGRKTPGNPSTSKQKSMIKKQTCSPQLASTILRRVNAIKSNLPSSGRIIQISDDEDDNPEDLPATPTRGKRMLPTPPHSSPDASSLSSKMEVDGNEDVTMTFTRLNIATTRYKHHWTNQEKSALCRIFRFFDVPRDCVVAAAILNGLFSPKLHVFKSNMTRALLDSMRSDVRMPNNQKIWEEVFYGDPDFDRAHLENEGDIMKIWDMAVEIGTPLVMRVQEGPLWVATSSTAARKRNFASRPGQGRPQDNGNTLSATPTTLTAVSRRLHRLPQSTASSSCNAGIDGVVLSASVRRETYESPRTNKLLGVMIPARNSTPLIPRANGLALRTARINVAVPQLLFRSFSDQTYGINTPTLFKAGRFAALPYAIPRAPSSDDESFIFDAANHLTRQLLASPFISTSTSFLWAVHLLLKLDDQTARVSVIHGPTADRNTTVYDTRSVLGDLRAKEMYPIQIGYKGAFEKLVFGEITQDAIHYSFGHYDLEEMATTSASISLFLRLDVIRDKPSIDAVRKEFFQHRVVLDETSATGIANLLRGLNITPLTNEGIISEMLYHLLQGWCIEIHFEDQHTMDRAVGTFCAAFTDCVPPASHSAAKEKAHEIFTAAIARAATDLKKELESRGNRRTRVRQRGFIERNRD